MCLKRKIKTPQLTFINTNQPKIHKYSNILYQYCKNIATKASTSPKYGIDSVKTFYKHLNITTKFQLK